MPLNFAHLELPHSPRRRPIIYETLEFVKSPPLSRIMELGQGLGPIFEVRVFGLKIVVVASAELAADLCDESRFSKELSVALDELRYFVGDGLFTAHNEEPNWQLAHNVLLPAFSKSAMKSYHPTMLGAAAELFEHWDQQTEPVNVSRDMTSLTLETIARCAFSRDFGSFDIDDRHPFVEAMVGALLLSQAKSLYAAIPGGKIMKWRINREFSRHRNYLDKLVDDMIAERRSGAEQHDDLLGLMLDSVDPQTGNKLDDRNIRYQILTFLVAGHETTSGALSFALHYLSQDPEIRAKAQAEADEILGSDPDSEPTFEQVPKFRYLRRVFDEALRLWPTAPGFARKARQNTTLGGKYPMSADDWAIVMLPMTQRDPAVWGDDAEDFDPDRFLPERSRGRLKSSYKPFGTGERACIGRQFALHEALLVLARIVHRYDFEADPSYSLQTSERLTIQPRNLKLKFVRRSPQAPATDGASGAPNHESVAVGTVTGESARCPVAH